LTPAYSKRLLLDVIRHIGVVEFFPISLLLYIHYGKTSARSFHSSQQKNVRVDIVCIKVQCIMSDYIIYIEMDKVLDYLMILFFFQGIHLV